MACGKRRILRLKREDVGLCLRIREAEQDFEVEFFALFGTQQGEELICEVVERA